MKQLNVRLPDDLHVALKALADTDHRSLNSEVVVLLERAVANRTARDSPAA
jgi:hypothetical protein